MKNTLVIILIGRIFQVLFSILILKISTTYLNTREMGVYFLLVSILSYFGMTLIGPVGHYVTRRVNDWKTQKTLKRNLYLYNIYVICISIVSIPLLVMINSLYGNIEGISLQIQLLLIPLGIYVTTLNTTFTPILNLLENRISFVAFTNLTLLVNLIFSVILVRRIEDTGVQWFTGQILAQFILMLISGLYLNYKIGKEKVINYSIKISRGSIKQLYLFSLPLLFSSLFLWVSNEAFRFILEKNISVGYVGIIGVGFAISTKIATSVETLVHQIFYPIYYKNISSPNPKDRENAWNRLLEQSLPLYISVTVYISFLAPFFLRILTSKDYYDAVLFVVWGAIFNFFRMVTNLMSLVTHSEYRTKMLLVPSFVTALVTVFLVILTTKTSGYHHYIPAAISISALLGSALMYISIKKIINIKLNYKSVLFTVLSCVFYALAYVFYDKSISLVVSLINVGVYGLYFLFTQWIFHKKQFNQGLLNENCIS